MIFMVLISRFKEKLLSIQVCSQILMKNFIRFFMVVQMFSVVLNIYNLICHKNLSLFPFPVFRRLLKKSNPYSFLMYLLRASPFFRLVSLPTACFCMQLVALYWGNFLSSTSLRYKQFSRQRPFMPQVSRACKCF